MKEAIITLIEGCGIFIYPLGLCSLLAVFISIERLFALRIENVIPNALQEGLMTGNLPAYSEDEASVGGRILNFFNKNTPDPEALKAFAKLESSRLERGLYILDIVVGAAPLLGLLGTVMGLVQVFSYISPETGMPEPAAFVQGIALALTTTMLGLMIAIPAMVGNGYIGRRVEVLTAKLDVMLERLMDIDRSE